jgi:hypothetical protein
MDGAPQRWWQWAFMYPTIVIALIGAVPQYSQWALAKWQGIPLTENIKSAQEQETAWGRNIDCLRGIDHINPTASTNYRIDLTSCPSGDILVTLTPFQNPDHPVSRWIVTRNLFTQVADSWFSTGAWAQGAAGTPPAGAVQQRIVDTRKDGSVVTQRIQLSDNSCVDETIDAFTGRHVARKPAPCSKF